ncbi:ABC-type glutathione transport system ATPase component, contains duplicated ATPase domain [Granulicatella balaenopterae]|uniref:ABC-type glutathione transport system ATPase component, contains duplicated ATPase domain n=1 Tax=Granulicatella balaenopterae TaxID=137733 RepID=A0A1H9HG35_9LACT|nr:ATP-binding cassette domain-containing protein [Granulicatella balaenopterae]SEQ61222.1 ABC-type glutathione transport system ATPase component, contains duplicated ATPase domain [Granulicatella balaenopterae]
MIKFKDFSLFYEGGNEASLKNIHLEIAEGEFILLTGLSGCGKTSLLRVINGLYPNVYEGKNEGEFSISLDGQKTSSSNLIGSVLQDSKSGFLFTELSSECIFPAQCILRDKKEIFAEFNELSHKHQSLFKNSDTLRLSAGQAQLLSILSQQMKKAKIIVMDEPSANLDLIEIVKLQGYLAKLKSEGFTIIIAEHRVHFFESLADRIIYLEHGEITDHYQEYSIRNKDVHFSKASAKRGALATLDILNLNYSYKQKAVLKDINITVNSGDVLGVVGNNGCGKSTFAKVICGLLKEKNEIIAIDGEIVSEKALRENFYYCMQDAYKQMVASSVKEEILLQNPNLTTEEVVALLQEVGLVDYIDQHPARLSGGQVQRLSILLAYISDSKVVVLDEPTSGLDYHHMLKVVALIKKMKVQNRFIFIISHDMEFLSYILDAYLFIDDQGRITFKELQDSVDFQQMMTKLLGIEKSHSSSDGVEYANRKIEEVINGKIGLSMMNPIVNISVFFALVNAIFMYPYYLSSVYLLLLLMIVLALNKNVTLMIKALISYSVIYILKGYFPISLQVIIEIFLLRGICANFAFKNITRSASLLRIIEAFHQAKLTDYLLLPLVCMLRIFPTFKYDVEICFMSLKTRKLINSKNSISIWNYMIVPLIHALIRTAENLATGIATKGMTIGAKRTVVTGVSFRFYDVLVLVLFFMIYLLLILGGV